MPMNDCIFCKIVDGTLPSSMVYETEHLCAFLDSRPAQTGHTLIVPRQHFRNIFEADPAIGEDVLRAMQRVAEAIKKSTGCPGINIIQNNGSEAGQTVFHLHWHIIPRYEGDGMPVWPQKPYPSMEAMNAMAETLRKALSCTD